MTGVGEVRARVAASYERLGMPSWPEPHPDLAPRDEEYSRVTDPGRYVVVHARARVWTARLGELPGVTVAALAPGPIDESGRLGSFDRGVRIASPRAGTLPLLLLERELPEQGASQAFVYISAQRPEIEVCSVPFCGCDACDSGSDELLQEVEDAVVAIIGGPFVRLWGPGWDATWHASGSSVGGTRHPDPDQALAWCRRLAAGEDVRLPLGTRVLVGRSWFE